MNNVDLVDSQTGLNSPHSGSAAPQRHPRRPQEPTNAFGVQLRAYFDQAAMSQKDFAEVLSVELQLPVSQVNLSNWLHGVEPRPRRDIPNLSNKVLEIAGRIAKNEAGRSRYADPVKVQEQFATWERLGITTRQVQVAGDISASLYRAWRGGNVQVPAARWELFQTKVALWTAFILEHQAEWQAVGRKVGTSSTKAR